MRISVPIHTKSQGPGRAPFRRSGFVSGFDANTLEDTPPATFGSCPSFWNARATSRGALLYPQAQLRPLCRILWIEVLVEPGPTSGDAGWSEVVQFSGVSVPLLNRRGSAAVEWPERFLICSICRQADAVAERGYRRVSSHPRQRPNPHYPGPHFQALGFRNSSVGLRSPHSLRHVPPGGPR